MNGDVLSVEYSNDNGTAGTKGTVSASWATDHFEAKMPEYHGMWNYNVVYPAPDTESAVDFGSARTQKGNAYNSKYDLMKGSAIEENADAGKTADDKDIVFNMTRQTAIAYFHLTSDLDEEVVSAKLSVTDGNIASSIVMLLDHTDGFDLSTKDLNEIAIRFEEGTAPKASNFQLWYNVLPTAYTSMSLEVKTANHTLTLNKNKGGNFVAGKLYKIHKDNVTWTENKNVTFFYESFDSCDGTGGNDGQWSGTIATSTVRTDNNANWTFENEGGAKACVKLGSSSSLGKATTPALGINTSTATLSFKAGAWDGNKENTTIKVTANNGGTVDPSTITLKKGEWTDYTCTISGATEATTLTFAASQKSNNRFFLDEVMVYYGNKPVVQRTQQISFSKTSVECYINDTFTEPVLSGNKTTVTYSSSDEKVATVDAASGKVTILSAGKTEITATAEETEEYKAASANYVLTVTEKSPTGPTTVVIDLSKQNFTNKQVIKEVTSDPVSLIFNKGTNTNPPKYYTTGTAVRLYGGNTMIVSSSKTIVKVELTFATGEDTNTITTDSLTYSDGTWTGESNSIKFTVGGKSGHRRVQKVSVTYNL